ncbi:NADH dehydrogenase (ubiquinone) 24 kDa subunit [Thermincola ferriacetica]|uniref:NADH dehydrogenase (Ubiquinone) 24 kDa subunit n=2 Tax=Thermincola TaxID=278993 RepID=D5XBG0_THEPJ|nr:MULTISPECIES: NAD(P)H-dependent oxidoreductase subunit E [Thermincola]ADG83389.1 NADH dehydrogenase (ubiquinone) 24 kDa subunit [Thermincola potens JR]KNZ69573.1 NADH dehydrogenase (ubiquinone) 24 kDa subunit [Thermincola ferriacetica]
MGENCEGQCRQTQFAELDKVIEEYRGTPGALIPVLHKAQEIFGYLPEEVQYRISQGLGLPLADVYGVVTFYSRFTLVPKGKHDIGVCLGTACYVKGAGELVGWLDKELGLKPGGITRDGLFSLETTRCVGACGMAPVVTIGEEVKGRLTVEQFSEIIREYQQK